MPKSQNNPSLFIPVIVSWSAHFITVIAGFLVPRLIDRQMGQELLGVWDLGWSLVAYCKLIEAGFGSSVNRYVAMYLRSGDVSAVNQTASSVAVIQRILAIVVLLVVACFVWGLPFIIGANDAAILREARWVLATLGIGVAISFTGSVYTGVLTGCQRLSLHHGFFLLTNIGSLLGMFWALSEGFGLIALAVVDVVANVVGRLLRVVASYRVCQGLSIKLKHFNMATARKMFRFGGKLFVGKMSGILMNQTVNVMIAAFMGPSALALFARPRSLVRQASVFSQKYAFMLVPGSAALCAKTEKKKIQDLVISTTRSGLFITLPLMTFLVVLGGPLLELWMGVGYANSSLLSLLALGFLAETAYQPLNSILVGRGIHGRASLIMVAGAIVVFLAASSVFALGTTNLMVVALVIVLPLSIAHGLFIPVYACKVLQIPFRTFIFSCWSLPLIFALTFGLGSWIGAMAWPSTAISRLLGGALIGGPLLAVCYFIWVLPDKEKQRFRLLFSRRKAKKNKLSNSV